MSAAADKSGGAGKKGGAGASRAALRPLSGTGTAAPQSPAAAPVSAAAALRAPGAPAEAFVPLSDSHAHLSHVAEEIQAADFAALLAAYNAAWAGAASVYAAPAATDAGSAAVPSRGCAAQTAAGAAAAPADAGLPLIVDIGTEPRDFAGRFALVGRQAFVRYALGVWPSDEWLADSGAALASLRASMRAASEVLAPRGVAAIGECGFDYHARPVDGSLKRAERILFEGQIELALDMDLPLIVHSRDAFDDTYALLKEAAGGGHSLEKVIIHCFGYGPEEAEKFLGLGCRMSFAGNLTYKKSEPLAAALKLVPSERLLIETDSPYLNPMPKRGRPCSSADIERTYAFAAGIIGEDESAFEKRIALNIARLFY